MRTTFGGSRSARRRLRLLPASQLAGLRRAGLRRSRRTASRAHQHRMHLGCLRAPSRPSKPRPAQSAAAAAAQARSPGPAPASRPATAAPACRRTSRLRSHEPAPPARRGCASAQPAASVAASRRPACAESVLRIVHLHRTRCLRVARRAVQRNLVRPQHAARIAQLHAAGQRHAVQIAVVRRPLRGRLQEVLLRNPRPARCATPGLRPTRRRRAPRSS